ncbi:hypothetical protein FDP41_008046 [Naegleria fowleri]|uniref:Uncharacterized protein n=1 Tax=Naegleria fowleri TaxID=5763 RepID=A0A6A5CA84_NAEFO|nr:uncharacterized protein FDP41_008046 [Naegleria fowleri]KAF0984131.1 hypothetical protein FDP41_008046 [Naegleria fowleri]
MQTPINLEVIKSLQVGKVYKGHKKEINGLDFFRDGKYLLCSSDDEHITFFDCTVLSPDSEPRKVIPSKKYGCNQVKFTHSPDACLYASVKKEGSNDDIRYLNIHTGSFIKYFKGHTKPVVSLNMCPSDDTFASTSLDNTMRVWDLRQPNEIYKAPFTVKPLCAYDPRGLVLAVATNSGIVKLYDRRKVESGSFTEFVIPFTGETPEYSQMMFSPSGTHIAISSSDSIFMLDSFNGKEIFRKTNDELALSDEDKAFYSNNNLPLPQGTGISQSSFAFTPNSQFLFVGTEDGRLLTLEAQTGKQCHAFNNMNFRHSGEVSVAFNPHYCLMVSACQAVCFWVPQTQ